MAPGERKPRKPRQRPWRPVRGEEKGDSRYIVALRDAAQAGKLQRKRERSKCQMVWIQRFRIVLVPRVMYVEVQCTKGARRFFPWFNPETGARHEVGLCIKCAKAITMAREALRRKTHDSSTPEES